MPEPVKVNLVSYGGVKPGRVVAGNSKAGGKIVLFDAASSTDGDHMFYMCDNLTSWDVPLPYLTDGNYMFSYSGLTTWDAPLLALKNGTRMFDRCMTLTSWRGALRDLETADHMFSYCKLDAASLEHIADCLPKWEDGLTHKISISVGASVTQGQKSAAEAIMTGKGWTVTWQ